MKMQFLRAVHLGGKTFSRGIHEVPEECINHKDFRKYFDKLMKKGKIVDAEEIAVVSPVSFQERQKRLAEKLAKMHPKVPGKHVPETKAAHADKAPSSPVKLDAKEDVEPQELEEVREVVKEDDSNETQETESEESEESEASEESEEPVEETQAPKKKSKKKRKH